MPEKECDELTVIPTMDAKLAYLASVFNIWKRQKKKNKIKLPFLNYAVLLQSLALGEGERSSSNKLNNEGSHFLYKCGWESSSSFGSMIHPKTVSEYPLPPLNTSSFTRDTVWKEFS